MTISESLVWFLVFPKSYSREALAVGLNFFGYSENYDTFISIYFKIIIIFSHGEWLFMRKLFALFIFLNPGFQIQIRTINAFSAD